MRAPLWIVAGAVVVCGCVHQVDRAHMRTDAELKAALIGLWKLHQNKQVLEYDPDGSFFDSCWVYPSGSPEGGQLIIVRKGRFEVREGIVYNTGLEWEVLSPSGRKGQVSVLVGPSKVSVSGDTMYCTPVGVYHSDPPLAENLHAKWTEEEMLYTGPPDVLPNGYRGRVKTTLVFSDSGTWTQTVEYPDRQPVKTKSQSGMFSYDPPLLWLSAEEIPARVEIHKGTMYRFACPYPVYSLRIPDSLRTTVINGTVTDLETQDPLVGTIVTLRTVGSTEARTTTANLAGKFEMRGVPSGSYTLHASALGHESQSYGPFSVGADSSYRMRHIFRLR